MKKIQVEIFINHFSMFGMKLKLVQDTSRAGDIFCVSPGSQGCLGMLGTM